MMINADAEIARVHFRHEFGVLGLVFVRGETRAKEGKDLCERYLSRGVYCSALIISWAAFVSAPSARHLQKQPLQFEPKRSLAVRFAIYIAFPSTVKT